MKVIIDTNSLLSLVRYYLPFDVNYKLYDFIKQEIANDQKAFKKIPAICKLLDLDVMTLPQLLARYKEVNFEFR